MSGARRGGAPATQAGAGPPGDDTEHWITLPPPGEQVAPELTAAIEEFDAGGRAAARAATAWLKETAPGSYATSRTRLLMLGSRIGGFYSLASAQVALSQRDRGELAATPVRVPAALVSWIAKDPAVAVDGKLLLLHAVGTARRAAALQATTVLVVDPFDAPTAAMWRERFGFRRSAEPAAPGRSRRLWLPLNAGG